MSEPFLERGPEPNLLSEARRLAAEAEALRADKRRLDWLEANRYTAGFGWISGAWRVLRGSNFQSESSKATQAETLRDAIDRAMGEGDTKDR